MVWEQGENQRAPAYNLRTGGRLWVISLYEAVSFIRVTYKCLTLSSSHQLHVFTNTTKREGLRKTRGPATLWGGGLAHLLVGDLQQLQHHGVRAHVPQKPLLLLPAFPHGRALLDTEFAEADQNLSEREIPSLYL